MVSLKTVERNACTVCLIQHQGDKYLGQFLEHCHWNVLPQIEIYRFDLS